MLWLEIPALEVYYLSLNPGSAVYYSSDFGRDIYVCYPYAEGGNDGNACLM